MSLNQDLNVQNNISIKKFVHIIESPSSQDLLDDRREGEVLTKALKLAQIESTYNLVADYETLQEALGKKLYSEMIKGAQLRTPIIHISAHGNENGIVLTDHTLINWDRLKALLTPINKVLDGMLLISLSSCKSFSACTMSFTENKDLPFFGLVSHIGTPNWADAAVAFVTFYHRFFKNSLVPDAVEAMKVASGDNGFSSFLGIEGQKIWIDKINAAKQEAIKQGLAALQASNQKDGIKLPPPSFGYNLENDA